MIRALRVLSVFALVVLVAASVLARPVEPQPMRGEPPRHEQPQRNAGERADTLFLFAASGPGSYGSPGTDARGFTFDHEGGPAAAGWYGEDLTAQDDTYWHLASTSICAGTGTDMSGAQPFDSGDLLNDYALWCGAQGICSWVHEIGYGTDWNQQAVLDLSAYPVSDSLVVNFAYMADFEGDNYDFFELRVESDGEWVTVYENHVEGEQTLLDLSILIPAATLGGPGASTRIAFHFESDGGWSDEDGDYISNIGAVWIDNIKATVDGAQVFASDFEDGVEPVEISFETPPGAGLHAELRRTSFNENPCKVNSSYFWTFFDLGTTIPEYPIPVIPFGPPYVHMAVRSPWLEVDQHGDPIEIGPDTRVWIDWWYYEYNYLNPLVFSGHPGIAARSADGCEGPFIGEENWWYMEPALWENVATDEYFDLQESIDAIGGGPIDAIAVRFWVRDLCDAWCNTYGDGYPHTPTPFYDNIRVKLYNHSEVDWNVDQFRRFQDNFAEADGKVRIDSAIDVQPSQSTTLVIGDSTRVELNMDPLGGIEEDLLGVPGEVRPALYMHFRISDGPHAGSTDPAMGDPDASDGIWSPHIGTTMVNGETWNVAIADSSRDQGTVSDDAWAFDFADDYFEPGDRIEIYYRGEARNGTISVRPDGAESLDPGLRRFYRINCLPTAGTSLLFVNDDPYRAYSSYFSAAEPLPSEAPHWEEALLYNGITGYDTYVTQAPSSGLHNGLGCRAELGQLAGYDMIIWDSGNLPSFTLTNALPGDLCFDTTLLSDWLSNSTHDTGLWVMGCEVASDLRDEPSFLNTALGAQRVALGTYYDDASGVLNPIVEAVHPDLYWEGTPRFLADGGCPSIENFDLVKPIGPLAEVTHTWNPDPGYDAVAGILNRDPDGDGTALSPLGHENRTLFNPFGYEQVWDDGHGLHLGVDYARRMVGHVLNAFFGQPLNDVVDAATPAVSTKLTGVHPNPFNPSTRVDFSLAEPGHATLRIYDLAGRRVRTLHDGKLAAGTHELEWHGRDDAGNPLASGVYFLRFESGGFVSKEKLVLLK